MLTIDMLRQNAALATLTDVQLNAIAEMSKNDEGAVIGAKIGALHGQYDADIFGITGKAKNSGEKSYDYAKRVLDDYKAEIDKQKAQISDMQSKLKSVGSDEALRKQLDDEKMRVTQLQSQLAAKETELNTKQSEFDKAIKNTHVDYAFQAAVSGLKFKSGITDPIKATLLSAAKAEVLAKGTPDFITGDNGEKILIMRDANGNILNNPKNNLNPYTVQELVMETSIKDVIDTGRRQSGVGTRDTFAVNTGTSLDLSGVKNQVEADKVIESYLLSNGLTRDSQEFANQSLQLRAENNVQDLPIK